MRSNNCFTKNIFNVYLKSNYTHAFSRYVDNFFTLDFTPEVWANFKRYYKIIRIVLKKYIQILKYARLLIDYFLIYINITPKTFLSK